MSNKKFLAILIAVTLIGCASTASLICYTVHLHNNCSIITYISNEVQP